MSADALVICRPTRRWCVGSVSANASADTLADALVGSDSLPLPNGAMGIYCNLHITIEEIYKFVFLHVEYLFFFP